MTFQDLDVSTLSLGERAMLAHTLIESLYPNEREQNPAFLQLLDSRLDALQTGQDTGLTLEELKAFITQHRKKRA